MNTVREQLLYNGNKVHVCMRDFTKKEHYEIIRLLLATRIKDVFICTHEATNAYIDKILKNLPVSFYQCFRPTEILDGDSSCQDAL
jgi:hypothetical protein